MEPFTITAALVASLGGLGALLKPLFKAFLNSFYLKIGREKQNIEISITASDGSVKSIKLDSSKSKPLTETEIKNLVEILKEANNAKIDAS